MSSEQDKRAILARRALLVSSALTSFSCAPSSPSGTAVIVSVSERSASAQVPTASARPGAAPVTPLIPWEERVAKAPTRFRGGVLPESSKQVLGWRFGQVDAALAAVKDLWLGEPDLCDGSRPECRDAWRRLGAKLKTAQDAARGMRPGLCGYPLAPSSLEQHLQRHATFVEESLQLAMVHWNERAAAFGVLSEQEWQKQVANSQLVPPMPCLSCVAPDRTTLSRAIQFDAGSATLSTAARGRLDDALNARGTNSFFEVWGHAAPDEADPVELAKKRAEAVVAELVKRGVDQRRTLIVSAGSDLARAPQVEIAITSR